MVSLQQLIARDFPEGSNRMFTHSTKEYGVASVVCGMFINFDDYSVTNHQRDGVETYLLDTCSFLKKNISEFSKDNTYIITCGVFLEILQGCTRMTIDNGIFLKDLQKLLDLKNYLGNNLVFLSLGRKRRAYWIGYEPSKSCRPCSNTHNPHHLLLRDIDTELHRLSIIMKCKIDTCDYILQCRYKKHHEMFTNVRK